jgi:hypothetical protein
VNISAFLNAIADASERFDAASLDRFVADHTADTSLLLDLCRLAESGDPRIHIAATGLLKRYLERGIPFCDEVVVRLLDLLPSTEHWETTLHLLQMLPRLSIPSSQADTLCGWLGKLTKNSNAFVRAWAYSGLHRVAKLYPEYRTAITRVLQVGAHKESASVRARLRQLPPLDNGPASTI